MPSPRNSLPTLTRRSRPIRRINRWCRPPPKFPNSPRGRCMGRFPVRRFHRRFRLFRPQSGQVMEAAIPISILAIGLARLYARRSTLLENVIITGIGGVAEAWWRAPFLRFRRSTSSNCSPPAGDHFHLPGGGCLGVLFLIPLRRYFVREMHGRFPFPKRPPSPKSWSLAKKAARRRACCWKLPPSRASTTSCHHLSRLERVSRLSVRAGGETAFERAKTVFNFDAIGFILGWDTSWAWQFADPLRRRRALQLRAGAVDLDDRPPPSGFRRLPAQTPIAQMTAAQIFRGYVRFVGVGAIATAGIFGVLKSLRIIAGSFGVAMHAFRRGEAVSSERTDRDVSLIAILIGVVVSALGVAIMLASLNGSPLVIAIGVALTLLFAFFFASVAASAIATTARNRSPA